ncbi:MAG: hypothetical protein ACO3IB_07245 [Phycisphaerales bacterium]
MIMIRGAAILRNALLAAATASGVAVLAVPAPVPAHVPAHAEPPARPIDFEDLIPEGLLKARGELAFDHLHSDYFRWDNISKVNFEPFPGDAIGRCINALTLLSRALHREASPSLQEIVTRSHDLKNEDGYLGPRLPESRANEDTLAGHNGYFCGLCEYARWTEDPRALATLRAMSANLFVPCRDSIALYRRDSEEAARVNWHLSGGDIGQLLLLLDGGTRVYALAPSPELKAGIETMIDRYRTLDLVGLGAQTHAMLSAATGILRWHELERRPEDLAFAESLYRQYRALAMTETYENYNWFNRPEWTEACAVIDSFILTVHLWRATGNAAYLEDAHLILFNGLLPGQTREGGFGTGPCVGANGIRRTKAHSEAPFCCSMRGGEGLARAIQYGYFLSPDAVTLAFYADSTALLRFSDGTCRVRQRTGYPHSGAVRLEFLESDLLESGSPHIERSKSDASREKRLCFFLPSWAIPSSLEVKVNGTPTKPRLVGAFAEISLLPAAGLVVELSFDQASGPRPALNADRAPGAVRHFRGPLLLGSSMEDGGEPLTPLLDILDPVRGSGGEPCVFFPTTVVDSKPTTAPAADGRTRLAQCFRHDTPLDAMPRAVAMLLDELHIDKAMVLCGLQWDQPQKVQQVIVQWPDDGAMPAADAVMLQWSESGAIKTAPSPGIIGNGRQWVYRVAEDGRTVALSNLVLSLRSGAGAPENYAAPGVQLPETGR